MVVMSDRSQSVSGSNNVDSFRLFARAGKRAPGMWTCATANRIAKRG